MGYIYLVTNKINNKKYVGQTVNSIHTRWIQHKSQAKYLKPNVYFIRAIRKYGADNFIVEELENCPNELLDIRQQYYIKLYDTTNKEKGYNSTPGGNSNNRKYERKQIIQYWNNGYTIQEISQMIGACKQTITTVLNDNQVTQHERRSRAMKKLQQSKKKIILQYDLKGNLINEYSCVSEAASVTSINESRIRDVCNHHQHTAGGYIWCHKDEKKSIQQLISEIPLAKTKRPITQYTLQGEFVQNYNSIIEAAQALNIHRTSIENALNNKSYQCNNCLWKYQDDEEDIMKKVERVKHYKDYQKRAVNQYDLMGKYIQTFDSAASAAIAIGKPGNGSSITKACNNKLKSAYKYKWAYAQS